MVLLEPEPRLRLKNLHFLTRFEQRTKKVRQSNQRKIKKSVFTKEETPSCEDRWDHQQKPLTNLKSDS